MWHRSDQWASPKPLWKAFPDTSLVAKIMQNWKITVFPEMGRIKITEPNSMILVSFSSAEDALTNDVSKHNTFSSKGT